MKTISLFIITIFISCCAVAQTTERDTTVIRKQLMDTLCSCVGKVDTTAIKSINDISTAVMSCFMTDGMSLFVEYAGAKGLDMNDEESGKKFGEEIGRALAIECPNFRKLIMKAMSMDEEKPKKSD